jgi:DNA (cytosine-5)-methyltransferase 1
MKVLSLFSGVGGFDMGLENAGMETVFQCEWDKHCRTILDHHWPTVPKWDDVSTLTGEYILAHAPVVDVVAWGSPCQDLSVAGKRAGLEGGRSGLFYEGIRIINELRKASNGKYPRISIWENVYGAINSNKGEDFEAILKEMVEAGSLLCEWRVLDAQYFGVPQRRRRVFVVAIFDSATADRCPDPLLPVSEGLLWNPTTRTAKRQEPTNTASGSIGSGREIANSITAELYHHGSVVNQDANNGHVVIEPFTSSSFAQYEQGVGTLRSNGGDLGGGSETLVVNQDRTYRDVTGALLGRDSFGPNHEGARDGKLVLEPMLLDGTRVDDVRVYESPVQTLKERMGTGGNNVPMLMFDTQFGSNANVFENQSPTLKASQAAPSVAYPIQDGRDIEKNQNGLGVAEEGAPSYTIDQTGAQAVAFATNQRSEVRELDDKAVALSAEPGTNQQTYVAIGIQGNVIGRQDHNGPAGKGHTDEGDPMFTLTSTDIHAVAYDGHNDATAEQISFYDGYNQKLDDSGVYRSLRIGRDSSDFVTQPINEVVGTLRSGGDGGVPSSRGEHLVTETVMPALLAGLSHLTGTTQDGYVAKIHEVQGTMVVRRLTPLECERLMGWPAKVLSVKIDICSDRQKNDVLVETSNLKSPNVAGNADLNKSSNNALFAENNSVVNEAKISKPVVVNARINLEAGRINLTNEQTGQKYIVSIAEKSSKNDDIASHAHIARLAVLMNTALDRFHQHGKVGLQANEIGSLAVKNGDKLLTLYGNEIEQLANIVQSNIEKTPADFMSTMSLHMQNTQQDDWILKTLCCYAMNVIAGYIPGAITAESSYQIDLSISYSHTQLRADGTVQSDTHRYKQCGNGVASPVAQWIGEQLMGL